MTELLKRRDFIRSVSLAGASLAIIDPLSAEASTTGKDVNEIKNDYFTVSFDGKKGTFKIVRSNGTPLLTSGTTCINLHPGQRGFDMNKRSLASNVYKHNLHSTIFSDQLGPGKKLILVQKTRTKN